MPIVDTPILEIMVRQLSRHGFSHFTFAVNHQADILKAYFGDGNKWNVKITYSLETQPLGTMGPLTLIKDLPACMLVCNGDILTDLNFGDFFHQHQHEKRLLTISAARRMQNIDYGVLKSDANGVLKAFEEKPRIPYLVSMGIYCISRQVIELIPRNTPFGFDQLVLNMLAMNKIIHVEPHSGYWLDIGRPDDYQQAIDDWPTLKTKLDL
jgi:NDP-sugar pyrophosphorylase family protein